MVVRERATPAAAQRTQLPRRGLTALDHGNRGAARTNGGCRQTRSRACAPWVVIRFDEKPPRPAPTRKEMHVAVSLFWRFVRAGGGDAVS